MIGIEGSTRGGVGGAHLGPGAGFGGFGRRGVLLESVDAGGSGAAPAPAPQPGAPAGATPTPAPAPQAQAVTFTAEQQAAVAQLTASARAEGQAAAQRAAVPPPAQPAVERPPTVESLQAELRAVRDRSQFDRRSSRYGLSDAQADDLFLVYQAQRPTDADAWFAQRAETFGFRAPGTTTNTNQAATITTTNNTTTTPEQRPPAAAPSVPGRVDAVTSGGVVDLYRMTADQYAQLAPGQARQIHEQLVAQANAQRGAPPLPRSIQTRR